MGTRRLNPRAKVKINMATLKAIQILIIEEVYMKRILLALGMAVLLTICVASPAFAGGDKVRGEEGQGDVNQVQVMDPPPFQP
jgi:hypothetical protein